MTEYGALIGPVKGALQRKLLHTEISVFEIHGPPGTVDLRWRDVSATVAPDIAIQAIESVPNVGKPDPRVVFDRLKADGVSVRQGDGAYPN